MRLQLSVGIGQLWSAACVLALLGAPAAAQQDAPEPIVPRCRGEQHRQFDFWVGEWEVRSEAGDVLGYNTVTRVSGGCALHENWRGASGGRGVSINTFDTDRGGRWTQRWVGAGATLWLEGGLEDGAMVLTGTQPRQTPQGPVIDRLTWSPLPGGRVQQVWDISTDQGATWRRAFVGIYSRKDDN